MFNFFRSGSARYLVTIEQITGTQDAWGQEIQTWSTFLTAWASIEELGGQESAKAQQIFAIGTVRIRMRYQAGITPRMRVTYGLRHFDIKNISDPDGRRRRLELICEERVQSGTAGE
jgi:SPP1 family predicted phage head-tail adaptor